MPGPAEEQLRKLIIDYANQYVGKDIENESLRKDLHQYMDYPLSGKPPQWCAYFSVMCWLKAFASFENGDTQVAKLKKAFSPSTKSMIYGWEDRNSKPTIDGFFRGVNTYNVDPLPEPKPGDLVFFRRPEYIRNPGVNKSNPRDYTFKKETTQDGLEPKLYDVLKTSGHVGLVESIQRNSEGKISVINTIEGNTTDSTHKGDEATGGAVAKKPGLITKGDGVTFPKEYWIHRNYFGIVAFVAPIIDPTAAFSFGNQVRNNDQVGPNSNKGKRFTLGEADFTSLVNIDIIKLVNNT